jgi:hypothetical protein
MDREDLRLAVYRAFAETGRAPDAHALAAQFGAEASEVVAGLSELARGRHLAPGDRGEIVMAHPFSTVPLGFSVKGRPDAVVGRLRLGFLRAAPAGVGRMCREASPASCPFRRRPPALGALKGGT